MCIRFLAHPLPIDIRSVLHDPLSRRVGQPSISRFIGWTGDCLASALRRVRRSKASGRVGKVPGYRPTGHRPAFTSVPVWVLAVLFTSAPCHAEVSVYWLYDLRHLTAPGDNANNFPVVEFKLFIPQSFGTFLMKEEIDLDGPNHNVSQNYTELSQSLKLGNVTLGDSPLLVHFGYSGGLGLFGNGSGGFYTPNAYNLGLEYRFDVQKAFCDAALTLRYTDLAQSRYGPMITVYAGRYFFNSKLLVANSLEAWTTPDTLGDGSNQSRAGTLAAWELESEVWYKVEDRFSIGTYVRTTRNVYALTNRWLLYPSIGVRYAF
jgi:hypothetical protein